MFIQGIEKRGHTYYAVYHGKRLINKVERETKLYIGNLENLDEPRRFEIEKQLKELGDQSLIQKFHSILLSRGYRLPSPISTFEIEEIYSYGQELALHKVCEEIELVDTINRFSPKGGGQELGKIVEIMAIARNWGDEKEFMQHLKFDPVFVPFYCKMQMLLSSLTEQTVRFSSYTNQEHL